MEQKIGVFLNDYTTIGGVEKATSNLIKALQLNYKNIVLISTYNKFEKPQLKYPETDVIILSKNNEELSASQQAKLMLQAVIKESITDLIIQIQWVETAALMVEECKAIRCYSVLHTSPFCYTRWYYPKFRSPRTFKNYFKPYI